MAQPLNINAASAAEMAEVLGLTISKCTQIVKGRMNTKTKVSLLLIPWQGIVVMVRR